MTHVNTTAPAVALGTATGQRQKSIATAQHQIPDLPDVFLRTGHVMLGFQQTLIGIGPICDAGFTVTFSEDEVVVHDAAKHVILSGCRDPEVPPALWYFKLLPAPQDKPLPAATCQQASLGTYSAYNLPSVAALVLYLHAAAGFPIRDTWL